MATRKDTAAVASFGDHEVIKPENKLRKAVTKKPVPPGDDARSCIAPATCLFILQMQTLASV